ncbi:pyridoxamine 5'-phosphate oxidase family protein [Zafaria sp. Z1313]|uniref:pyridoxamine 5'-phosphate oxidase family protein n=1 Tax=unclassified Zafaria TaxID=2828765 RepID=UPI002E76EAE8|nr:pyridoxamine 5'-phosphate oxidase family protein [Zafaria sp. J156]MEE1622286.1 pyridoxamine 5'-phosphate oxidase family protein [Zafaria sp. J156]
MMFEHEDGQPVMILDTEQCWTLLGRTHHGRIALSVAGNVDIVPVNHAAHEGKLYFRTAPGNKLAGLTINPTVAFESDGILSDQAWSVVVRGTARVLETEAEIELARAAGVRPWVQTLKDTWVEITPREVTGRHFLLGNQPEQLDES